MSRCYPSDDKLMLHLQAFKLCVVALDLMQRTARAKPQGKVTNTHNLELLIIVADSDNLRRPKIGCKYKRVTVYLHPYV
jgi:hypothetical protein